MSILRVNLVADTKRFDSGLGRASTQLKSFGKKVSSLGSSLQRFSIPLQIAGGAAIKMAADFDKSMTKIKTLVGVASVEVDQMGVRVKQLASQTGISSAEAADALFFITSAGLRGADAMAVLEQSTKAAALGLGEAATVADLATSALNAYGKENISAEAATDVLTASVREGKLEASELSAVMGGVLPIASNMGVQFHEVGAAFAAMSRTGTPAAQAATQLNSVLMGIMKPSKDAAAAMGELGLSSEGLRKQIQEEGLLSVFMTLKDASERNSQAFERVFGNVRALKGIMDLTGASFETTQQIFDNMSNTAGVTAKSFEELQNSAEFKLRKGLKALQNSFADLGAQLMDALLPAILKILGVAKSLFERFNKLDQPTKNLVIAFTALATALPAILTVAGGLVTVLGALASPAAAVAAAVAAIAYAIYKNWNEVLPVAVGLYNRFVDLYNGSEKVRLAIAGLKFAFKVAFATVKASIDKVISGFSTMWNLIKEFSQKGFDGSFTEILENGLKENVEITEKLGKEIGEAYADSIGKAAADRMEYATVSGVQGKLSKIGDTILSGITFGGGGGGGTIAAPKIDAPSTPDMDSTFAVKGDAFSGAFSGIDAYAKSSTASLSVLNEKLLENTQNIDLLGQKRENFEQIASTLSGTLTPAFGQLGNAIVKSMGLGESALGSFASVMIDTVMQAIAAALSNSIANAIVAGSSAAAGAGPIGIALIGGLISAAVGTVKSAFGKVPALAKGGIVSAPTLAMVGDNRGAGRGNPEVIAPLNKLEGMLGNRQQNVNVGGTFKVQGQDLVLALQRAEKTRSRLL